MAESRVDKYRDYRESLKEIKASNRTEEGLNDRESKVVTDSLNTTSTLPIEDVLGKISEDTEERGNKILTRKNAIICILATVGFLLVAGIVIFAVIAFRK